MQTEYIIASMRKIMRLPTGCSACLSDDSTFSSAANDDGDDGCENNNNDFEYNCIYIANTVVIDYFNCNFDNGNEHDERDGSWLNHNSSQQYRRNENVECVDNRIFHDNCSKW